MLDDITYRLNVNSGTRVYSVSLPASSVYAIRDALSIDLLSKSMEFPGNRNSLDDGHLLARPKAGQEAS